MPPSPTATAVSGAWPNHRATPRPKPPAATRYDAQLSGGSKIHIPNTPAPSTSAPTIPATPTQIGIKVGLVEKRRSRRLSPAVALFFLVFATFTIGGDPTPSRN